MSRRGYRVCKTIRNRPCIRDHHDALEFNANWHNIDKQVSLKIRNEMSTPAPCNARILSYREHHQKEGSKVVEHFGKEIPPETRVGCEIW